MSKNFFHTITKAVLTSLALLGFSLTQRVLSMDICIREGEMGEIEVRKMAIILAEANDAQIAIHNHRTLLVKKTVHSEGWLAYYRPTYEYLTENEESWRLIPPYVYNRRFLGDNKYFVSIEKLEHRVIKCSNPLPANSSEEKIKSKLVSDCPACKGAHNNYMTLMHFKEGYEFRKKLHKQAEREMATLIESVALKQKQLSGSTTDEGELSTEGRTANIIREIMAVIGIKTDDFNDCTGEIFAKKCLDRLKMRKESMEFVIINS